MNKIHFLFVPLLCISLSCSEWPLDTTKKEKQEIIWRINYPVWVSDTRLAAFVQRNIAYEGAFIYEFDAYTGENRECLTEPDSLSKATLVVSRDRTKLAYGAADEATLFSALQMYVFDRETRKITQVTNEGHQENPEFSQDNSMLIFNSSYRTLPPQTMGEIGAGKVFKVHVQNIDGSRRRCVDPTLAWADYDEHFLPDGKHIVLRSWRTTNSTLDKASSEVYVTGLSGSIWKNLSILDYGSSHPLPSSDGRYLLLNSPATYITTDAGSDVDPPGLKISDLNAVMNNSSIMRVPPYKALPFPHIWKEKKWSPDGQ